MNTSSEADTEIERLRETQDAFDSVAADYDGARGNNDLIQDMRKEMWHWLDTTFAPGSHPDRPGLRHGTRCGPDGAIGL